jgi:hypothetical protein
MQNKFSSVSSDRLVWKDKKGNEVEVWTKEHKKPFGWKWKVHKLTQRDQK